MLNETNGYTYISVLGRGDSGEVHLVESIDGKQYALKITPVVKDNLKEIKTQVEAAVGISHPNILKVHGFFFYQQQQYLAIFLDYCPAGNLCTLIGKTSQTQSKKIMLSIAEGLAYLHNEKQLCHLNIKPQNILIKDGAPKLSDIGIVNIRETVKLLAKQNNQFYVAPEVLNNQKYDFSCDVWSLGVVFLQLILGKRICDLVKQILQISQRQHFLSNLISNHIKDQLLRQLLHNMVDKDPKKRLTSRQVLERLAQNQKEANQKWKLKNDSRVTLQKISEKELIELLQKDVHFPFLKKILLPNSEMTNSVLSIFSKDCNLEAKFPELQQIDFSRNNITDAGYIALVSCLQKFKNLERIKFNKNKITHLGLEALAQNIKNVSNLRRISLANNNVTDVGLIKLILNASKFPKLQIIGLAGNYITNAGLQALANSPNKFENLLVIYLDNNKIRGDGGLKALAGTQDKLKNLYIIGLCGNNITNQGLMAHIDAIKVLNKLNHIILWDNEITDYGLKTFVNAAKNYQHMKEITLGKKITDHGIKQICQAAQYFPNLQVICLGALITDEGVKVFTASAAKFSKLQRIGFSKNKITDQGLKEIINGADKFKQLKKISLKWNKISKKAIEATQKLENVQFTIEF